MRNVRFTVYRKLLLLILLLLVPILAVYTMSNQKTVGVVKEEIYKSNKNQLLFFASQLDRKIEDTASYSIMLLQDRSLSDYRNLNYYTNYTGGYTNVIRVKNAVIDRLALQQAMSGWISRLTVFAPQFQDVLSTDYTIAYDEDYLVRNAGKGWRYDRQRQDFFWYAADPQDGLVNPLQAKLIIETRVPKKRIEEMLGTYEADDERHPFLYRPGEEEIRYDDGDDPAFRALVRQLDRERVEPAFNRLTRIEGEEYVVNLIRMDSIGWYLVDYVPLEKILTPITKSRNSFYLVIAMLLLLGLAAAVMLYRTVQVPVRELLKNMQRLRIGDFSARIRGRDSGEFGILYERFNAMARQIQELVEKVYTEQLRSREATLKQLQAQINPHFLYNSLYYIKNMARLGEVEAVEAMALNLGDYYRYTTRNENQTPQLKDEVALLRSYLEIQNLRMKRIGYEIDIPDGMLGIQIPRLLLQPLVENAIVHGIEPKEGDGLIVIRGRETADHYEIRVEDNGVGLPGQELEELRRKIGQQLDEEMGCGLWNVNQRLMYRFGEEAALSVEPSALGGLSVGFRWRKEERRETT